MYRKLILSAAVSATLALSACSSDDDDANPSDAAPSGDASLPVEGGPEGDASAPAPDSGDEDNPVDNEPSGNDTSAVAGLWDAVNDGPVGRIDQRYVAISTDGLYTEYDYRQDDLADEGNCYDILPLRLDLEIGEATDGEYSLGNGQTFALTAAGDGSALTVTFDDADGNPLEPLVWEAVAGIAVEDLEACGDG